MAPILRAIADARCGLQDWEGAEPYYREALARLEALGQDESSEAAGLLCNLGYLLDQRERFEESDAIYHQRAGDAHYVSSAKTIPTWCRFSTTWPTAAYASKTFPVLRDCSNGRSHWSSPTSSPITSLWPNRSTTWARSIDDKARQNKPLLHTSVRWRSWRPKCPTMTTPDLLVFLRNTAASLRSHGDQAQADALAERAAQIAGS